MTRHRPRAVLLLFLLLSLTACSTWQSIGPVSPSQFIELDQPERVRVYMRDGRQVILERPAVDGDELVASGVSIVLEGGRSGPTLSARRDALRQRLSWPLADVLRLDVRRFDAARTIVRVGPWALGAVGAFLFSCSVLPGPLNCEWTGASGVPDPPSTGSTSAR